MVRENRLVAGLLILVLLAALPGCSPGQPQSPEPTPAKVAVESVSLDKDKVEIVGLGTILQLTATVSPDNATNQNVSWKSLDPAVVTVESGYVKSVAAGTAIIVASTEDGGKIASCEVTVIISAGGTAPPPAGEPAPPASTQPAPGTGTSPVVPTAIELDVTSLALTIDDSAVQLLATVLPDDAIDKKVNWTSTNPQVATVSQDGVVTPLSKGTTTIRASTTSGGLSASCSVSITAVVPMGIALDRDTLFFLVGGTPYTLSATVLPGSAENKAITWTSSNPAVATVDASGKITPLAEGTSTITARTKVGDVSASCEVSVQKLIIAPISPIIIGPVKVTGVTLDRERLDLTARGLAYTLQPQVEPPQSHNKKVAWHSSNPDVASVDSAGKVVPLKPGHTVITVTTEDGGYKSQASVLVEQPNTEGSTGGNLLGGGMMAFQGGWIYYRLGTWSSASDGLVRIRMDGSRYEQLSTDGASSLNVVGDWVYYVSNQAAYRIRTDGTERTLLNNIDAVSSLQVIGNTIYYLSNNSVYKMTTTGSNREKISDARVAKMYVRSDLGKIIYVGRTASGSWKGIYAMNIDGTGKSTFTSDTVDRFTIASQADIIYYTRPAGDALESDMYRIIASSGSKIHVGKRDWGSQLVAHGQHVFYRPTLGRDIYRIRYDGQLSIEVASWGGFYWYYWNDTLYFPLGSGLDCVNSDGTNWRRLR